MSCLSTKARFDLLYPVGNKKIRIELALILDEFTVIKHNSQIMKKLTVKFSNSPSPLEQNIIPNGSQELDIFVNDIFDPNEVLDEVERHVEKIENPNRTIIEVEVYDERRGAILRGNVQNGSFSGVLIS